MIEIIKILESKIKKKKNEKRKEWQIAEDSAELYLKKKKNYKILARNYKTPFGEIDIIASYKDKLIFVEVKSGNSMKIAPSERVDFKKYKKILQSAEYYINNLDIKNRKFKFQIDVVEIRFGEIKHYEDIGWDFS